MSGGRPAPAGAEPRARAPVRRPACWCLQRAWARPSAWTSISRNLPLEIGKTKKIKSRPKTKILHSGSLLPRGPVGLVIRAIGSEFITVSEISGEPARSLTATRRAADLDIIFFLTSPVPRLTSLFWDAPTPGPMLPSVGRLECRGKQLYFANSSRGQACGRLGRPHA